MAMSKKCFVFVMALIVAAVTVAVIFVVIKMQNFSEKEETVIVSEEEEFEPAHNGISRKQGLRMCEAILNGTETSFGTYNDPAMFNALLGMAAISSRVTESSDGDTYQRSSFWLTGDIKADSATISTIRKEACRNKIPVIVMAMRPRKGMRLSDRGQLREFYKPESLIETWDAYDRKLNTYMKYLSNIPSVIIMEPDLMMYSFDKANLQYTWLNNKYKEQFYHRVQRVIKVFARSWVYIDAGNAAYLTIRSNMETMAKSLLRLDGLRGFAINTGHYFNTSYNNAMARRLHCMTGLHYITDTSRNGGPFSRQGVSDIEKCFFDPPRMLAGLPPGWSWGTKLSPRQKRWTPNFGVPNPPNVPLRESHTNNVVVAQNRQPPNQQEDPEGYNQWINQMGSGGNSGYRSPQQGSQPQAQPTNYQPSNYGGNSRSHYTDLLAPTGKVPIAAITASKPRQFTRNVKLRQVQDALGIYSNKALQRYSCLRKEAVSVHDANVWIMTPGISDGRLYEYGTYHKCLLGHTKKCDQRCRLSITPSQRPPECECDANIETANPFQPPAQQSRSFGGGSLFQSSTNQNTDETNSNSFFPGGSQILYSSVPDEPRSGQEQSGPPTLEQMLREGR